MTDRTLPGKSLEFQFDAEWQRFERLAYTTDTFRNLPARVRRWITPVNVSFIIPIEDQVVCAYLSRAQEALKPHMAYAPQPADKLHITLFQLGFLRSIPFQVRGGWSRTQLDQIAHLVGQYMSLVTPFEVQIGPVNAFPNVAFVEVHDLGKLRLLSGVVSQAIPPLQLRLPRFPMVPHVTLGFFGRRPAAPIRNTLRPMRNWPPVSFRVEHVDLTLYYPQPGPYSLSRILQHSVEEVIVTLPLGEAR